MKKSLFLSLLIVVSNISAFSYFVSNSTQFPVQLKVSYDTAKAGCSSKSISVPAFAQGVKIEDTMCCVSTLKAWRVDKYAPTNIIPEEASPSEKCGTHTYMIYANPNGSVSVID